MHGRAEYFDRGSWNKVDDPVLNDFRLSGTCVAGSTELDAGYLIGNEVYRVEIFLKRITFTFSENSNYGLESLLEV